MNTLTDAQRDRVLAMLREGKTLRRVERETGHRRETIAAYARRAGLLGGVADLSERRHTALCAPHRDAIEAALAEGTSLRALHDELIRRRAFRGSYSTLKRYVRTLATPSRATPMMRAA